MTRRWALPARYTLRRNSASIMKDLILTPSAVATGGPGEAVPPLTTACVPPFWFIQITVFETSHNGKTTTMMVKGVITFKHNSPLKFS